MHSGSFDVIVIGGSYAGLSAALTLGRARKRVLVVDAGQRRNRFAHTAHNLLGFDGHAPGDIIRAGRAEVATYPTTTFLDGEVMSAVPNDTGFTITLADGSSYQAARLILAFGITDDLPSLPGLREGWGKGVLHCPYCHGYEVAGKRLGVLAFGATAMHLANLIPDWGPTIFFTNGAVTPTSEERDGLRARGVAIEDVPVSHVTHGVAGVSGVRLADGRKVELDAVFVNAPTRLGSPLAEHLGCDIEETALGPVVRVDMVGRTSVPEVYAAGDAAQFDKSLAGAIASGKLAATMAHQSLLPSAH